jgi:hypothetical protein
MSDIEGKVAREAMSECGQRASFNCERAARRLALFSEVFILTQDVGFGFGGGAKPSIFCTTF